MRINTLWGLQARLADAAGISRSHLNDCLAGRRNASGLAALRLAGLTATDPRLWLKGGDLAERRASLGNYEEPLKTGR